MKRCGKNNIHLFSCLSLAIVSLCDSMLRPRRELDVMGLVATLRREVEVVVVVVVLVVVVVSAGGKEVVVSGGLFSSILSASMAVSS